MLFAPVLSADVAKLVATKTRNLVAPAIFLDQNATVTPSVVQIFDQKVYLKFITVSAMLLKETVGTEATRTCITHHYMCIRIRFFYDSSTIFNGTHFGIWVFVGLKKLVDFKVSLLNGVGQTHKESTLSVDGNAAVGVRTSNLLELVDPVYRVLLETIFAKLLLMLALTEGQFLTDFCHFFTYLTLPLFYLF
jgi:hypothetical protein